MQIVILLLGVLLFLIVVIALSRHKPSQRSGNAANTDNDLESLYSLLGDNSGRMKK